MSWCTLLASTENGCGPMLFQSIMAWRRCKKCFTGRTRNGLESATMVIGSSSFGSLEQWVRTRQIIGRHDIHFNPNAKFSACGRICAWSMACYEQKKRTKCGSLLSGFFSSDGKAVSLHVRMLFHTGGFLGCVAVAGKRNFWQNK